MFVQGHAHQIKFIVDWGRRRGLENADLKVKQISCKTSKIYSLKNTVYLYLPTR